MSFVHELFHRNPISDPSHEMYASCFGCLTSYIKFTKLKWERKTALRNTFFGKKKKQKKKIETEKENLLRNIMSIDDMVQDQRYLINCINQRKWNVFQWNDLKLWTSAKCVIKSIGSIQAGFHLYHSSNTQCFHWSLYLHLTHSTRYFVFTKSIVLVLVLVPCYDLPLAPC